MPDKNSISPVDAAILAKKYNVNITATAVRNWVTKYNLGVKVGGRLFIDKIKFVSFLKGEKMEKEEVDEKTKK